MPVPPAKPPKTPVPVEEYLETAEKVRTGEYFREARSMYDLTIHDPMAERYVYMFITAISLVALVIALNAVDSLYPLNTDVPLIVEAPDNGEGVPRIRSLLTAKNEDPSGALVRFMVAHYVLIREEYDIATFDRNVNGIKSQSAEPVFREFQRFTDPRNPESPITLYQRHSKRKIRILAVRPAAEGAEVIFQAIVESRSEIKTSNWRANIAFNYSGIELDEKTGTVNPVSFVVTKYQSKRLQDVK